MIELKNLSKRYDKNLFLDLNCKIYNNGIYKISGFSGTGKTTLLKCILNIEDIDEGEIFIDNEKLNKSKSYIGNKFLFLNGPGILFKNVSFNKNLKELKFNVNHDTLNSLINLFNVQDLLNQKISTLSEGQAKILNIIYILSIDVPYYFLDEPFAGIDQNRKQILKEYLLNLSKEHAIVFIDHEGNIALKECDIRIDLPESKVDIFHEKEDIKIEKIIPLKKEKYISKRSAFKRLVINNKLSYSLYLFLLVCSSVFLSLGVAFLPYNETQIINKIEEIEPSKYLNVYYKDTTNDKLNEFELLESQEENTYFISINPAMSAFFYDNTIENGFNFGTSYRSNLLYLIEKDVPNDKVYYEIDTKFNQDNPLINIEDFNNKSSLKIELLNNENSLAKSNKFVPYNASTSSFLKNCKRTDILHFSINSFVDFINNKSILKMNNYQNEKVVTQDFYYEITSTFLSYSLSLTLEKNVCLVSGMDSNKKIDVNAGDSSTSFLVTTGSGNDLPQKTIVLSLNNFCELFSSLKNPILGFLDKNDTSFLTKYNIEMSLGPLENYKKQDLILYYSIAFFIVGGIFLIIFISYFILNQIKLKKESTSDTLLKSLSLTNKEVFYTNSLPLFMICLVTIIISIIFLFIALPLGNFLAYQDAFMFEINYPLYSIGNNVSTIYDNLDLLHIREFSFIGLMVSLIPSCILLINLFLIERIKK